MSVWATATSAANTAVMAPTQVITRVASGGTTLTNVWGPAKAAQFGFIKANTRATRNTPAATIVAAWISALTGSALPWRRAATRAAAPDRICPSRRRR